MENSQNKRTIRRILTSNKLPLFHYKILESLSLQLLTKPDKHTHNDTQVQTVLTCLQMNSVLHDLYQRYYEMPLQTWP